MKCSTATCRRWSRDSCSRRSRTGPGGCRYEGCPCWRSSIVWIAGRISVTFSARNRLAGRDAGRCQFPVAGRRGGGARDPGRAQLEKSQCGDAGSAAARRQCRVSSRGAFPRRRGNRNPDRHCRRRAADLADRRPHHSELHPQLAGARKSRPPAGAVRPVRHDRRGDQRAGAGVLGRRRQRPHSPEPRWHSPGCCIWCGSAAGPATAPGGSGCC